MADERCRKRHARILSALANLVRLSWDERLDPDDGDRVRTWTMDLKRDHEAALADRDQQIAALRALLSEAWGAIAGYPFRNDITVRIDAALGIDRTATPITHDEIKRALEIGAAERREAEVRSARQGRYASVRPLRKLGAIADEKCASWNHCEPCNFPSECIAKHECARPDLKEPHGVVTEPDRAAIEAEVEARVIKQVAAWLEAWLENGGDDRARTIATALRSGAWRKR